MIEYFIGKYNDGLVHVRLICDCCNTEIEDKNDGVVLYEPLADGIECSEAKFYHRKCGQIVDPKHHLWWDDLSVHIIKLYSTLCIDASRVNHVKAQFNDDINRTLMQGGIA